MSTDLFFGEFSNCDWQERLRDDDEGLQGAHQLVFALRYVGLRESAASLADAIAGHNIIGDLENPGISRSLQLLYLGVTCQLCTDRAAAIGLPQSGFDFSRIEIACLCQAPNGFHRKHSSCPRA